MNNINEYLPHGFCIAWNQQLLAMHVISDLLIALAYFSIPAGILYVARKRTDAVFQPFYYLFAAFILACGVTHVMGILTLWIPLYYAEGITKMITAAVSVATAVYLLPKLKEIMALPDLGKLSQLNDELAEEVESRKQSEASLKESQMLALQAQKTQAAFLANMSHEIRTPMNGVLGAIDLLRDTTLDEVQHRLVAASRNGAESLLALLNDILDISKIESGKMTLREDEVDLTALLEDVALALSFDAEKKGLDLVCPANCLPDALYRADAVRLRQVLLNLVGNAIKFTESGFVVVTCREIGRSANESVLEFSIKDSGIGIDPKDHANLFKRFTQLDSSNTRRAQGSGLGLAIVRELVELMGGTVSLNSEPRHGTEVLVTLSLKFVAQVQPNTQINAQAMAQNVFQGTVHLALVCQHTSNYLLELLGRWGYEDRLVDPQHDLEMPEAVFKQGDILLTSSRFLLAQPAWKRCLDVRAEQFGIKTLLILSQSEQTRSALPQADWVGGLAVKPLVQKELRDTLQQLSSGKLARQLLATRPQGDARITYSGKVLVVEDSTMNQMVVCKVLESMGVETSIANNGKEALELLQKESFDAVLMDGQMPVMDGYEATRIIRSGSQKGIDQKIPVVALTAHAMSGEDQKCFDAGMNDYLTKPLDRNKLSDVLGKYLARA